MAQSTDLVVPNTSGAGVRSGINTRLQAIATHQSGATAPTTTYAYQFWADTTAGLLKQRDGSNASWNTIGTLGTVNLGHAPLASPTFTGTPAAPTATAGTSTTQLATTAFVTTAVGTKANLASPTFTGTPAAPTATAGTSTTQLATTAFVQENKLVLATAQNSTSGTSIDFTGIPSWAKRVTVMFNGVSTSGASDVMLRIGAGSIDATGYTGTISYVTGSGASASGLLSTGFFLIYSGGHNAVITWYGSFTLTLLSSASNLWVVSGTLGRGDAAGGTMIGGAKTLSGTLDRLRITTVSGTDTFDAGSINILYE